MITLKKRGIFIGSGILLLLVGIVFASEENLRREIEMATQRCGKDVGPIPVKRLSDEKTFPFLLDARPLSDFSRHPEYKEYRAAVTRFPHVRACLMDSEQDKQIPDLTHFNWNDIKWKVDAEVCLFRVFSSIGSIDGTQRWLESQGFQGVSSFSAREDLAFGTDTAIKPRGLVIDAYWNPRECGQRFAIKQSWLGQLLDQLMGPPYWQLWVAGWFTADGEVLDTTSAFEAE